MKTLLYYNLRLMQMNRPLISIAPMLDITNKHFRFFIRLLTSRSTLYTQMLHENAIVFNPDKDDLLGYDKSQHPLVLQIGGSDPEQLSKAAKIVEEFKYDEINLNIGCPSKRVQKGSFGACLMKQPDLVAECMNQMRSSVKIPCTVKCRIGVDNFDSYEFLKQFIGKVSEKGKVNHFIIHARKAFLKGLNPAQNRRIPPLKYDVVYKLKEDFPQLKFTINGGIKTVKEAYDILKNQNVQGCMIGRTAYQNPWELATIDKVIYNHPSQNYSRKQILVKYSEYADTVLEKNPTIAIHYLTKPIMNFFNGEANNAKYRQFLSNKNLIKQHGSFVRVVQIAMQQVDQIILEERKYDKLEQKLELNLPKQPINK